MEKAKRIGILGEEAVAAEYRKQKCNIVCANYRCRFGEIDIIAESKENILIVCEVKTRKQGSLIDGKEAVTLSKQQKIITTTKMFLAENQLNDIMVRFDVAEVTHIGGFDFKVDIIENAFSV